MNILFLTLRDIEDAGGILMIVKSIVPTFDSGPLFKTVSPTEPWEDFLVTHYPKCPKHFAKTEDQLMDRVATKTKWFLYRRIKQTLVVIVDFCDIAKVLAYFRQAVQEASMAYEKISCTSSSYRLYPKVTASRGIGGHHDTYYGDFVGCP